MQKPRRAAASPCDNHDIPGLGTAAFSATQVFTATALSATATVFARYHNVIVTAVVNGLNQATTSKGTYARSRWTRSKPPRWRQRRKQSGNSPSRVGSRPSRTPGPPRRRNRGDGEDGPSRSELPGTRISSLSVLLLGLDTVTPAVTVRLPDGAGR